MAVPQEPQPPDAPALAVSFDEQAHAACAGVAHRASTAKVNMPGMILRFVRLCVDFILFVFDGLVGGLESLCILLIQP